MISASIEDLTKTTNSEASLYGTIHGCDAMIFGGGGGWPRFIDYSQDSLTCRIERIKILRNYLGGL